MQLMRIEKNSQAVKGGKEYENAEETVDFFSLLMCFGIFQVNDVKAAPGIVKLTAGKTYTKYDVTGNGKKDKIIIRKEKKQDIIYRGLSITLIRK